MADEKVKEETKRIPMALIFVDHSWNSRSGGWQEQKGEGEFGPDGARGLPGLVDSIKNVGQDTAVDVRPLKKGKYEYQLVTGFRRFEAMRRIAEEGIVCPKFDPKNPMILANIRNLDEAGARALNGRENIERESLRPADVAWHIAQLESCGLTQAQIAQQLGYTQSHVSKMAALARGMKADVFKIWREAPVDPLLRSQWEKIAETPKEQQKDVYEAMVKAQEEKGGKHAKTGWMKRAIEQATKVGKLLGALHREGHATTSLKGLGKAISVVADAGFVDVKGKNGATELQWEKLTEALKEGYEAALHPPAEESKNDVSAAAQAAS